MKSSHTSWIFKEGFSWFQLSLAYRWVGMKYESGSGTELFLYDITTSGPELRLSFHF